MCKDQGSPGTIPVDFIVETNSVSAKIGHWEKYSIGLYCSNEGTKRPPVLFWKDNTM